MTTSRTDEETVQHLLRGMASNYGNRRQLRPLDCEVCLKGANEIAALRSAVQAMEDELAAAKQGEAVAWQYRVICQSGAKAGPWVDCGSMAFNSYKVDPNYEVRALYARQESAS
jgi:hypothetical protein